MGAALDALPGFRRRIAITPADGHVTSELEDDYHCMGVRIAHDGAVATKVRAEMDRAPWRTCPGAAERLRETFEGVPLAGFARRGEKTRNCTHLHDLATWGAAHAHDAAPFVWDVLVSDPVDGISGAELRRDGTAVLGWTMQGWTLTAPDGAAGMRLDQLRDWIDSLDPARQEAARVLRWATMIAHGRAIPLAEQSDPHRYPGNCYTFQPENAADAVRVGAIRDFSREAGAPLDGRRRK